MKRLRNFLVNEELDPENVHQDKSVEGAIKIENATFRWDKDEEMPTIKEYELFIPSLVHVVLRSSHLVPSRKNSAKTNRFHWTEIIDININKLSLTEMEIKPKLQILCVWQFYWDSFHGRLHLVFLLDDSIPFTPKNCTVDHKKRDFTSKSNSEGLSPNLNMKSTRKDCDFLQQTQHTYIFIAA